MINDNNFRDAVNALLTSPDEYTKDEIYTAFLEMTELYLNEMVNTLNMENAIINKYGEEKGSEIIEDIATTNPCVADLDDTNALEADKKEVIRNLMAYIDFDLGCLRITGDDDSPDSE